MSQENNQKEDYNKTDLVKLQKNYFEAMLNNARNANETVTKAQNWILTLGLAELAFLGSKIISSEETGWFIKASIVFLLVSFILFIFGSISQFKHALRSARAYDKLSIDTLNFIKVIGSTEVGELPKCLSDLDNRLTTSRVANICFIISILCVILATLGLIIYVITLN